MKLIKYSGKLCWEPKYAVGIIRANHQKRTHFHPKTVSSKLEAASSSSRQPWFVHDAKTMGTVRGIECIVH